MKLVTSMLTKNPCYQAGKKIKVKGLMLHSVGCPQPKASAFLSSWNKASFDRACVHAFIDAKDGTIYQTLPWNHRGWHAGGSANQTHIGVEMCEPGNLKYTSGSSFTCGDKEKAKVCVKRTYEAAVELFAMLCKEYRLNPMTDIVSHKEGHAKGIASNHGDPEHLWKGLSMGYTMDTFRKAVKAKMGDSASSLPEKNSGTQATIFSSLTEAQVVEKIGKMCQKDMKTSGVLASVSAAQFLLESGYGKSELAQKANNCFGMKCSLSGNTWSGSTWDGKSKYTKQTKEEYKKGTITTITAQFRKYANVEASIADHSAYLLGAMNGSKKRYAGLKGERDYHKAIQIIKDGEYATSSTYVEKICSIIEKYHLTVYDGNESQSGTEGNSVPYRVRVCISDLNIRIGPGTNHKKTGKHTGKGVFTIVEEADGPGATKWGLLKSYADKRNGWISLDYTNRL